MVQDTRKEGSRRAPRSCYLAAKACCVSLAALIILAVPGFAQVRTGVGELTGDQLQQLQRNPSISAAQLPQPDIVLQPVVTRAPGTSELERLMSRRAGQPLQQFGYNALGLGHQLTVPQVGAVQDDYLLGPGDEIVVTLRGQENNEFRAYVDRDGRVILPRLNPISATGRTFGSFREDLQAAVHRTFVATDAFVSIGRVRQITVMVTGEVNEPGQRIATGLSSVVDALLISGGVKKSGSLRNIRILRGDHEYSIDLYAYLLGDRGAPNLRLADGDRILVPIIGPTVGVSGPVQRPGIYELKGQSSISAKNLLPMAGGLVVQGKFRYSVMRVLPDGQNSLVILSNENQFINRSEVLIIQPAADQTISQAQLLGGSLSGQFPVTSGTKLSDVLKAPGALGEAPYTLFGIIARQDPRTLLPTLIAFTPVDVLNGTQDMTLQARDNVRVFSLQEHHAMTRATRTYSERESSEQELLHNPLAAATGDAANPGGNLGNIGVTNVFGGVTSNSSVEQTSNDIAMATLSTEQAGPGPTALNGSGSAAAPVASRTPAAGRGEGDLDSIAGMASGLGVESQVLMNFLLDHQVVLDGAIRGPGLYLIGPQVTLSDVVLAAGGTVSWADESGVELISTAVDPQTGRSVTQRETLPLRQGMLSAYVVRPNDVLRFRKVFSEANVGRVTIQGEVRYAGSYQIIRGEHLSDLLMRAGGLTNAAYPNGTVFLRKSVAAIEREGYMRAADEIEEQVTLLLTRPLQSSNATSSAETVPALQSFVKELRDQKALGRIAIIADPSILAAHPDRDPILEANDVIFIPPRPSSVVVLGKVMHEGGFPYVRGASVKDYINRAGGYARFADDSETFVVLPDGSARKVEASWLTFNSQSLPPGSAIVVPRDLTPLDLRQTIIDLTTIFSQLAISAASLAVLSKQ